MTPAELKLIEDLFKRMGQLGPVEKDREADKFIRDAVRQSPDAPYFLVQSVLVQDEALRQAAARIRELEGRSSEQPSGSFLGARGLSGGSVPSVGPQTAPAGAGLSASRERPFSEPASGGFLASALSTAASVAGGMLLADGIRGLFGGHYGSTEVGSAHLDQSALDRAQDQAQDTRDDADEARQELAADDAALDDMQDAQDDAGGDWGGGDV
jgi:uncharacterized protein